MLFWCNIKKNVFKEKSYVFILCSIQSGSQQMYFLYIKSLTKTFLKSLFTYVYVDVVQ